MDAGDTPVELRVRVVVVPDHAELDHGRCYVYDADERHLTPVDRLEEPTGPPILVLSVTDMPPEDPQPAGDGHNEGDN